MATTSSLAQLPIPALTDRVNGPQSFSDLAKKLEDMVVVPYSNATARSNAYSGSVPPRYPTEGSLTYLRDSDTFEFYTGASWQPVLPSDWSRGVLRQAYASGYFPTDGTYIPASTERVIPDVAINSVQLINDRMYRVTAFVGGVDGGVGSSPTGGGAALNVRYNTSSTAATSTSNLLAAVRVPVLADLLNASAGGTVTWSFQPSVTGPHSFGLSLLVNTPQGARVYSQRQLIVEDLGKLK